MSLKDKVGLQRTIKRYEKKKLRAEIDFICQWQTQIPKLTSLVHGDVHFDDVHLPR